MEVGFSTLKGKGQDLGTNKHGNQAPYRNEPGEKKGNCLCKKPHFLERCYSLIDSIQPPGPRILNQESGQQFKQYSAEQVLDE
jgi:hypothetical protein